MATRQSETSRQAALALFPIEVLLITELFWADIHHWHHVVVLSKTPYLLLIGWISLRLRGLTWRSVGTSRPQSRLHVMAAGLVAGFAMEALELYVTQPVLVRVLHQPPDLSALAELPGHVGMLAMSLLFSWTLAAFGEELVWRGYLVNRVADMFGQVGWRWAISLMLTSICFGLAHFDQGRTGITENMIDGALLCALYFASGRSLWVPIIAHGITDSLDSVLLFSGHYPLP